MDSLDERIIAELSTDGRKSYRDIARSLNVSLSTVSTHIKNLEKTGLIRGYTPILDIEQLGYTLTAIINLKISKGRLLDVQRTIAKDHHVQAVYDITGDWDSMSEFQAAALADFV